MCQTTKCFDIAKHISRHELQMVGRSNEKSGTSAPPMNANWGWMTSRENAGTTTKQQVDFLENAKPQFAKSVTQTS